MCGTVQNVFSNVNPSSLLCALPSAHWSVCRAGKHSAQWALDDVLVGMNDSSRTGFHDRFDGIAPLRHNWYRIQGGEVTVDCLSLDTALTFNSEAIDSG